MRGEQEVGSPEEHSRQSRAEEFDAGAQWDGQRARGILRYIPAPKQRMHQRSLLLSPTPPLSCVVAAATALLAIDLPEYFSPLHSPLHEFLPSKLR